MSVSEIWPQFCGMAVQHCKPTKTFLFFLKEFCSTFLCTTRGRTDSQTTGKLKSAVCQHYTSACQQNDVTNRHFNISQTGHSKSWLVLVLPQKKEMFTRWYTGCKHICMNCSEFKEAARRQRINWILKSGDLKSLWFMISGTYNRTICLYLFEVYLTPSGTFSQVPLASDNFLLCFSFDQQSSNDVGSRIFSSIPCSSSCCFKKPLCVMGLYKEVLN